MLGRTAARVLNGAPRRHPLLRTSIAATTGILTGLALHRYKNRRTLASPSTSSNEPPSASHDKNRPELGRGSNTTTLPPLPYDTLAKTKVRKVQPPPAGEVVEADRLWKDNGAIVMIIRRPLCVLCRNEADGLSKLLPRLQQEGFKVKLVG
jgi:hypothetical protein